MKKAILATLTLSAAVIAAPLLAQSSNPQGSDTKQPSDVANASSASSAPAGTVRVTGTVTLLSDTRVGIKIEKAESQPLGGPVMPVGKTRTFALDPMTDKPLDLKVGDRVDLWFKQDASNHLAARIALASSDTSSATSDQQGAATSQPASSTDNSATNTQPSANTPSTDSASQVSNQGSQPSSDTSADSKNMSQPSSQAEGGTASHGKLPKTASELPLIGIIGLAALFGVLLLRFTVRT